MITHSFRLGKLKFSVKFLFKNDGRKNTKYIQLLYKRSTIQFLTEIDFSNDETIYNEAKLIFLIAEFIFNSKNAELKDFKLLTKVFYYFLRDLRVYGIEPNTESLLRLIILKKIV